ncbi:MAG: cysteine--tRNA ligase, partial [Candidatus Saccharibacteria bacterium]
KMINSVADGKASLTAADREELKALFDAFVFEILGLKAEAQNASGNDEVLSEVMELVMKLRLDAKARKDWATSDQIRNELNAMGFNVKDTKEGATWELKK